MATKVTVEYCFNCDGGRQELNTTKQCVLDLFPEAQVEESGSDGFPIVVTIKDDEGNKIWTGSQKDLFRKYAERREQSIVEIKDALKRHYGVEDKEKH